MASHLGHEEQIPVDHFERTVTTVEHPGQISWGAVIAGLVVIVSVSWLMLLLGSAIGVSIADAADMEAVEEGLGWGLVIWLILTALIAFFLGGWFAGRLADKTVPSIGMLHGVTVWGVSIVLMLALGYVGVTGLLRTGQALVGGGATMVGVGAGAAAEADGRPAEPFVTEIQAQLKRQASEIAARTANDVSPEEVERAIDQLDAQTLQQAAIHLIRGNTRAARDVLVVNTHLSEQEINAIIDGAEREVQQRLDTIASYTQAVLWTTFISSALGLGMAILGGWAGANRVRRFYAVQTVR
jgi:hypothetical protein